MQKVSVIVPIYKAELFINRCVRSLFSQTLHDVEYIFIDDCTPDQSMEILDTLIEEYQARILELNWIIRIERMQNNSGSAAVRSYAIQLATGDYVIHCDSDDWIEDDMISEMWHLAIKDNLDVVVCDYNHVKSHETIRYKGMKSQKGAECFFYEVLSIGSSWSLWNKLFRRSLYDRIVFPKAGMNMGEDMAIVLQLLYSCNSVGYVNKPFYNYCDNTASITNTRTTTGMIDHYLQWLSNVCLLESFFKKNGFMGKAGKKLSHLFFYETKDYYIKLKEHDKHKPFLVLFQLFKRVWSSHSVSLYGKKQFGKCIVRILVSRIL